MIPERRTRSSMPKSAAMFGVLILIAAIAGFNWAVAPHWNYLQAAERYESARDELSLKSQSLRELVAARRTELEELEKRHHQIQQQLFKPGEATRFLNGVQSTAENAGCTVRSLTFPSVRAGLRQLADNAGLQVRRASLSVLGGYGQIMGLVGELQNRSQQVSIESIGLRVGQTSPGKLECNMTIAIWVSNGPEEGSND